MALPLGPRDPLALGIAFVHQDLGLAELMSVVENLFVGRHLTGFGWRIRWRAEKAQTSQELAQLGLSIGAETAVSTLPAVDRATIAILRALKQVQHIPRGLLVLDEPTSYLPRDGVERLFGAVQSLASSGFGVLFVTHRLEEVRAIGDTVTILRDGEKVLTADVQAVSSSEIVKHIIGRSLNERYRERPPARDTSEVVLSVRGLSGKAQAYGGGHIEDFDLDLRRGEIVGVTGLVGMGYEAIPYLLFGVGSATAGIIKTGGERLRLSDVTPRRAIELGCALLPANRLRDGSAQVASVAENVTLPTLGDYFVGGLLHRRREVKTVEGLLTRFDVRPRGARRIFGTLSGGNQQKALLAKWFATNPDVLLLHEPTQGVDIGAKEQIFSLMRDAAASGTGVMIASAEYEDLAHLCNRVLVLRYGSVVCELHAEDLAPRRILEECFRQEGTGGELTAIQARQGPDDG